MKRLFIMVYLLVLATASAADKHADRKPRDEYAQQFAAEVEHHGWQLTTFAMRPGCPYLCINHGNHDCLRIILNGGTVEAVDRLGAQELAPRIARLRELGFVEVDILGLQASHTYPDGIARFQIHQVDTSNLTRRESIIYFWRGGPSSSFTLKRR